MQALNEFLNAQAAWHWWALGALLIALEIASTTQYLLWPGISAFIVGLLKFADPGLDGRFALFLFAVVAVVATIVWKRSPWGQAQRTTHATLNDRSAQYLGRSVTAVDDFAGGHGAVRIDDSRWNAIAVDGSAPHKGDALVVIGADGAVLQVKAPA